MTLPLVFLPSLLSDARVFSHQVMALSRERSVMVAHLPAVSRVEDIAAQLADQLPPRFALAGMCLGGAVAMELMTRVPDRVERLCLISASPLAETPTQAAEREPLIVRARAGKLDDVMADMAVGGALAPGARRQANLGVLQDMARELGPDVFETQSRSMQRRPDYQATLRRSRVRTLIMCGAQDKLTHLRRHEFMAQLMPEARLRVIDDAAHYPTLEAPEASLQALRHWLNDEVAA